MTTTTTTSGAAIKVVHEWRSRPGQRERFAAWLERFAAAAAAAPGFQGASVFSAGDQWLLLVRFASAAALAEWQHAPATAALLADVAPLADAGGGAQQRTGLETWFTLPGAPAHTIPPRWKMALVTWCALLPQVLLLGQVIPHELPLLARAALGTAIPVALLTWVVMPLLTRWLRGWLFAVAR